MLFNNRNKLFVNKPILKDLFSIFVLIASFFVTVATSYDHVSLMSGQIFIVSDCNGGSLEAHVNVSNYQILDGSGLTFLDFGFPSTTINPDVDNTGMVGGKSRNCKKSFGGNSTDKDLIFTCYDNDEYACSILIQKP